MKSLHIVTFILLIVGGLNIGLTSLGFNVIDMFLDEDSMFVRVLYLLIGISAIYELISHKKMCRHCTK